MQMITGNHIQAEQYAQLHKGEWLNGLSQNADFIAVCIVYGT